MRLRSGIALVACIVLAGGCGLFGSNKRKPADLQSITATLKPRVLWSTSVGGIERWPLEPAIEEGAVFAAAGDGRVTRLDANGRQVWRRDVEFRVSAGVAAANGTVVVGGLNGNVAALDIADGKLRWKKPLPGELLGRIVITGNLVIVRSADARLFALDLATGERRWDLQRPLPPLILRADAGLALHGDLVVASFPGGRLLGVDVKNGLVRFDATVALPKGTTELERITDVVGTPAFEGDVVCVAAYQGRVGCLNAVNGQPVWGRDFSAPVGVATDSRFVYGVDETSVVQGFSFSNGTLVWTNDSFKYRAISSPLSWQDTAVVGDYQGYLHFLNREDGKEVGRLSTDGGAIRVPMQLADTLAPGALLAQTSKGGIYLIGPP